MAPDMQKLSYVKGRGRMRSCVRPFCAVAHGPQALMDSAGRASLSVGRDLSPSEAARLLSIRRVDRLCHHIFLLSQAFGRAAGQQIMLPLLRVGKNPVCS